MLRKSGRFRRQSLQSTSCGTHRLFFTTLVGVFCLYSISLLHFDAMRRTPFRHGSSTRRFSLVHAFPNRCRVARHCRPGSGRRHLNYPLCLSTDRQTSDPFFANVDVTTTATSHNLGTATTNQPPSGYQTLFDLNLPEGGRCVGIRMGNILTEENNCTTSYASWITDSLLHPAEIDYARRELSSVVTQTTFLGGRLAMRHAMGFHEDEKHLHSDAHKQINLPCNNDLVILKDSYGRPRLPPTMLGSISHKGDVAVAWLVSAAAQSTGSQSMYGGHTDASDDTTPRVGIGVDLEVRGPGHARIARRILTDRERISLGSLPSITAEEEVLLRFSVKEALYKAMHPLICQYVGFMEAECQPLADGSVDVQLNLISGGHMAFASVAAHWRLVQLDNGGAEYFLTTARVSLKPGHRPTVGGEQGGQVEECEI